MGESQVKVALKPRCFVAYTVGGVAVEIFTEKLDAGGVELCIKSPKKIGALRVYQELPGFGDVSRPAVAGQASADDAQRKRAS